MKKPTSEFIEITESPRTRVRHVRVRRQKHPVLVSSIIVVLVAVTGFFLAPLTHYTPEILHDDPSAEPTVVVLDLKPIKKQPDNPPETGKTIYLTFDDGPSPYTAKLLDTLKKYNVKATFFVTGAGDDNLIAREYKEGHAIGIHTFSHDYSYIYANTSNFFADLNRVQERIKNIIGSPTYLIRFPGGSSNTISTLYDNKTHIMSRLIKEVSAHGYAYFDWNVASGDTDGATSSKQVYQNVVRSLKPTASIILQHDIKDFSVDAVARIIEYGLENGYNFAKLDADSFPAHHGVNN